MRVMDFCFILIFCFSCSREIVAPLAHLQKSAYWQTVITRLFCMNFIFSAILCSLSFTVTYDPHLNFMYVQQNRHKTVRYEAIHCDLSLV